jgi:hypothetical protein
MLSLEVHLQGSVSRYKYGHITWRVTDRYELLLKVAAEDVVTPRCKQLSQVSVCIALKSSDRVHSISYVNVLLLF